MTAAGLDSLSVHLWGVCFNGRAALGSAVQRKVNEGLGIGESHLVDSRAHGSECNARVDRNTLVPVCSAGGWT